MVNILHIGNDGRYNELLRSATIEVTHLIPSELSTNDSDFQNCHICVVDLTAIAGFESTVSETLQLIACPSIAFSYGIDPTVVERAKHLTSRSPLTREQLLAFLKTFS